ncbi:hypothetical protein GCM10007103_35420 [Salinimicrobium marinum]|uniref:Uncharacterized protein n=1 Tax=Salinimicrobium marinum TaxID=680283 RepID=A0A918SN80_9FLAO|nr:hypothetical protein GCM10007103_35420 [Salinimicrobium marinum]
MLTPIIFIFRDPINIRAEFVVKIQLIPIFNIAPISLFSRFFYFDFSRKN